jgi:isopentenyldiphosphate isomerase
MSYLERINACNTADTNRYLPFLIDDQHVGWLKPELARRLSDWPGIFLLSSDSLHLARDLSGFNERSDAVKTIIQELVASNVINHYLDEPYPVTPGGRDDAMMVIDRGAASYFGIRCFGQHLNAYVVKKSGLYLWIARRARDRRIFPGLLDNMVAGGLPWHTSLHENLLKECMEEAGLSPELAAQSLPVGTVNYLAESSIGIKPDTLYCYDLELPQDFMPVCTDGEVESFELLPVEEVMDIVRDSEQFKPNCNLVIIDFLIRHGYLGEDDGGYEQVVSSLHRPL